MQCSPWCCRTQHDPITTLHLKKSARPQVTSYSRNVHNSLVTLLPGLAVAGFGGSVPAFRGEEQVWAGLLRTVHMVCGRVESHCAGLGAYLHQASRTQKNTCKSGSPVCCVPTSVATRTALVPVLVLVPMMVLVLVPGLEVMANEVETAARTRGLRSRSFS